MAADAVKLAVIGHPVAHSLSPMLFSRLAAAFRRPVRYGAVDAPPERLARALESLAAQGYAGVNVTRPHKEAALRLADRATPAARAVGAANVLSFTEEGLLAHNTDAAGFADALRALRFSPAGRDAVVFGAGGAARAAGWALGRLGARRVRFCARSRQSSRELAEAFSGRFSALFEAGPAQPAALWVNATPLGWREADPSPARGRHRCELAFDMVYGRDTAFLRAARRCGARAVDGCAMLACQAARAWEFWLGAMGRARRLSAAQVAMAAVCEGGRQ